MTPIRFPYTPGVPGRSTAAELAYLPISLSTASGSLDLLGLLDTGSMVNVLPYSVGLALGFVWQEQTIPVSLTGNLSRVPAFGVILTGRIESCPSVELAFAWTQAPDAPLILGQVNFFMEFDVCFFRTQGTFEISPRVTPR
jgi:hypothetical protein